MLQNHLLLSYSLLNPLLSEDSATGSFSSSSKHCGSLVLGDRSMLEKRTPELQKKYIEYIEEMHCVENTIYLFYGNSAFNIFSTSFIMYPLKSLSRISLTIFHQLIS